MVRRSMLSRMPGGRGWIYWLALSFWVRSTAYRRWRNRERRTLLKSRNGRVRVGGMGTAPKMEVGRIVNISSVHGLLQAPRALVYEAGKAAVVGLTRQMAVDFGPLGITVNAIAPGHIVTERGEAMWAELGNDAGFGLFERHYPVRRTGVPADIANAIAFLCSPDASFITGVVLPVDGGMTIQLQENIVMHTKDYIVENPELRTHFDSRG